VNRVRVLRKSYPFLKMGDLLIKGDGNFALFGGAYHPQRYPPADAHVDDPNQPDVPAFAHTGAHGEQETGIPGVGKVFPGQFVRGNHGEIVYKDESGGEHLHGIDGVIRRIGKAMRDQGLRGDPKEVVQNAIDRYNRIHPDKDNHLPDVDSMMWRKIVVGPYQRDVMNRGNYGPEGKLITTTTNSHGDNHRYGTFLESYSIPFHNQLDESMKEVGFQNPRQDFSFVGKPYIRPENLHYVINPLTGSMKSGAYHIPSGHLEGGDRLPSHITSRFDDMGINERAFEDIYSWDIIHHLPDTYFLPKTRPASSVGIVDSAMEHMNHVLGADTSKIGTEIKQTIPLSEVDESWRGTPLQYILGNTQEKQKMFTELAKYPAFHALFGRTNTEGHVTNKIHNAYAERYGEKADKALEHFLDNVGYGADVYGQSSEEGGRRRTLGTQKMAAKIKAKMLMSGTRETDKPTDANSNFRHDTLTPEEIQAAGLRLNTSDEAMGDVENVRRVIEYLAHMNSIARGHQPRRQNPTQEEINNLAPVVSNRLVGGFHVDRELMGIPDHIRSVSRATPSASAEPVQATSTIAGAPPPPPESQGPPSAATERGPPTTPVRAPPVAVAPSAQLSPFQQRRQAFAQASPAQVEQTMREVGSVRPGAPISPEQLQQFQQTISDPYQTFLTDYMKSADEPEVARDRLMKAVEQMQIEDAKRDVDILKYLPSRKMSLQSNDDVSVIAKKMDIAPIDVHTIVFTKGDWTRISKKYGYSDKVVKVVKTAFGGE
jgi:hypothetical protein